MPGFLVGEIRRALRDRVEGADDLEGFGVASRSGRFVSERSVYQSQGLRSGWSGGRKINSPGLRHDNVVDRLVLVPEAGQANADDHRVG